MHIAEGVLSAPVLVGSGILSGMLCYVGFKRMPATEVPRVALVSALFFVGSFIHVPLGPTSVHLVLNGMVGLLLGLSAFPAILVALFIQALLFGFGGLTTLGVNLLIMALPALAVFFMMRLLRHSLLQRVAPFIAGFSAVLLSAFLLVLMLALSGETFLETARLAFFAYIPVMVIEGIITFFLIRFLKKVYPEALLYEKS